MTGKLLANFLHSMGTYKHGREVYVILHNIRSLHNVGSMFRTADAAGVSKLFLTGYTPTPVNRLGAVRSEITKTALGAERIVSWEHKKDISAVLKKLRSANVQLVAVEQDTRAVDYRTLKVRRPVALLMGNEVRGLSRAVRNVCDAIIEIPMRGQKESLNVSVAFGVVLYSLAIKQK